MQTPTCRFKPYYFILQCGESSILGCHVCFSAGLHGGTQVGNEIPMAADKTDLYTKLEMIIILMGDSKDI